MSETVLSLGYKPIVSIVMPVYNAPEPFLREAIQSVLNQAYPHWELCIADDASTEPHVRQILEEYQQKDFRVKVVFREQNGHISATSNSALELATGEFVALLDHDDVLTPDALYENVLLLNRHPEADMMYSDEDKLDKDGNLTGHFFKPDWCPDSFLSRMYTCHFGVYRRSLIEEIGGFRCGFEGSQDYDLVLRLTEKTHQIYHIPKVLYHWRMHSGSAAGTTEAKPYAYEAAKRALQEAIARRGERGTVRDIPKFWGHYTIRYAIAEYKKVSIIISTKDLGHELNKCLTSVFTQSFYPNYEVILVDNGSREPLTQEIIQKWQTKEPERFRSYQLDIPFNFSKINNDAVRRATGDYLLFLNNDTEAIAPDWIDAIVEQAQRPSIGAVGVRLRYPDDSIQHAGVILGIGHVAAHSYREADIDDPGYYGQVISTSNYSSVTAACMMCRREVFEQVGGFDEELAVAYNDVDLCLKMLQKGYRNVYLPHVILYHHESKSRGHEDTLEKQRRFLTEVNLMRRRWKAFMERDPHYNINLTLSRCDYSLRWFCTVEIKEIALYGEELKERLDFALDSPQLGTHAGVSDIEFSGWAIAKKGSVMAMRLLGNRGQFIKEIPVGESRPDLLHYYRDRPEAEFAGFRERVEIWNIFNQPELQLQACFEDGSDAIVGKITLQIKP